MTNKQKPKRVRPTDSGSVLLPVVAAMLILLLSGITLSELFTASTILSVHSVESAQAFWIAEAGLWHAAHENSAIATPVAFAGGTYTVTQNGSTYVSIGTRNNGRQQVQLSFEASPSGGSGPLDGVASAATASKINPNQFSLDLISTAALDVELESFSLSANGTTQDIDWVRLKPSGWVTIWTGIKSLPTGTVTLNAGSSSTRTIGAGDTRTLRIEFDGNNSSGAIEFVLILNFTNGSSSTITFTINW